jgi:Zn-dependent peptidase ImmA (M78 family)
MENSGCLWDDAEDRQLKKLFNYKVPIFEIAEIHGRSEKAIHLRLIKLGLIKEETTDNFVWEKFKKKLENNPSDDKSKAWELLCETLSEIINEKSKEN